MGCKYTLSGNNIHDMIPSLPEPTFLPAHDIDALSTATCQLHFGSQYLAAAGQSFLTAAADDSHTNLGWSWNRGFLSRPFELDQTYQLVLNIPNFRLDLQLENGGVQRSWNLAGQPRTKLYQHLRSFFAERQPPDGENYQPIDHYSLPDPQLDTFEKPDLHLLETLTDYRHNA
jgi:hypothetical protein